MKTISGSRPATIAQYPSKVTPKTPAGAAKMVAKTAPLPVSRIEESRKYNAELIKGLPAEVELKSQSVAI